MKITDRLAMVSRPGDTTAPAFSLFPSATEVDPAEEITLAELIGRIRDGEWRAPVEAIHRAAARGDRDAVSSLKRKLPGVTLSCAMVSRSKDAERRIKSHTGLLQCDFDAKDNPHLDGSERDRLKADPHVAAVFVGPSGAGIKAVVRIDAARHRESVEAAIDYFRDQHGVVMDRACKDVERLCFVSWDPEAWARSGEAALLPIPERPQEPERGGAGEAVGEFSGPELTAEDVREVLSYIPKRPPYETWLRVASGVFNTLPLSEAVRVLQEWSPEEKPGEYERKWKARLKQVHINTVIWIAQQHGFDAVAAARRKRWMGRVILDGKPGGAEDAALPHADLLRRPDMSHSEEDEPLDLETTWALFEHEQEGDAALWWRLEGHRFRYDSLAQCWRIYNPATGLWERDEPGAAVLEMSRAVCAAYDELIKATEDEMIKYPRKAGAKKDGRDDDINRVKTRIAALRRRDWSNASMDRAQRMPQFQCRATDFDRNPHLLGVRNGVLDFSRRLFLPHSPEHRLSVSAPVEFVEGATCPETDRFLETCFDGDAELIAYIWRALGYSLTGLTDHDALFFCHGSGSNGKSTFFNMAMALLGGQLSGRIDVDIVLGKSGETSGTVDYKKATLEGKRLIVTDEIPDDRRIDEAMVKRLIGGDSITARRPYEKPYEFLPTHKIWAVGNHKPKIKGVDHGIWRRIHLIPWTVTIPEHKKRPRHELMAAFLRELPGILNRCIEGFDDVMERGGIAPPKAVLEATEEYRDEEDTFAAFWAERVRPAEGERVKMRELHQAYVEWCRENREGCAYPRVNALTLRLRKDGRRVEEGAGRVSFLYGFTLEQTEGVLLP